MFFFVFFFFFQAEDGIRDLIVTGVQTCALPIYEAFRPEPSTAGIAVIVGPVPPLLASKLTVFAGHKESLDHGAGNGIVKAVKALSVMPTRLKKTPTRGGDWSRPWVKSWKLRRGAVGGSACGYNPALSVEASIRTRALLCAKGHLRFASGVGSLSNVPGKPKSRRRSGCPVSIALEKFGDRWSLLIIRDLMVRGFQTFKEFQGSGEGIATNILADRLRKLEAAEIITAEQAETDGRRVNYRLTEKGIDLAPVL